MSPIQEMYMEMYKNIAEIFHYFRSPKTWVNYFINLFKKKG